MSKLGHKSLAGTIRIDDSELAIETACQNERKNWVASRVGLQTIGSKLVNQFGIEWVVQNHAAAPTLDSLQRWRNGEIEPENDLYPVVAPMNLSPRLMEFFHAFDRCTTKKFAILDTMPGRRADGHVPGENSIDTVSHPVTNLLFLDAARVHESIIAHEFGHAWVQYVDECEDLRTVEDASDPQWMRHVNYVQSFVLDLKVNDLLRRKGFDMAPIEDDQARSIAQLAAALESGYRPEHPREEVFMALLVADEMIQRERGQTNELARFDKSLATIRKTLAPLATLSETLAASVARHGYDSHASIIQCIDDCLIESFKHVGDSIDLDTDLTLVNREEPNLDKFPDWHPILPPAEKCQIGKHMAHNDITSDWLQSISPSLTGRARVAFRSPDGQAQSHVVLSHPMGPPTPYFGMTEDHAEFLEIQRQNVERRRRSLPPGFHDPTDPIAVMEFNERNRKNMQKLGPHPGVLAKPPGRSYMAGLGRFLTAARLSEQLAGEQPYAYAFCNPTKYTDPSGLSPISDLLKCIQTWAAAGFSPRQSCEWCKQITGYSGGFGCGSLPDTGKAAPFQAASGTCPPMRPAPSLPGIAGPIMPWPDGGGMGAGSNFAHRACEASCKLGCRGVGIGRELCKNSCVHMCYKFAQGGCTELGEYCDLLAAGGQKNQAELCESLWNLAGCPGKIASGD